MMKMEKVKSSNIDEVGYSADDKRLRVAFKSGHAHDFLGVPESAHKELLAADSPGRYFNTEIRTRFAGQKVEAPEQPVRDTGSPSVDSLDEAIDRFRAGTPRP